MIQALFRVLLGEDEGLQAKEAIARTEQRLTLTEFERATFLCTSHSEVSRAKHRSTRGEALAGSR